MESLIYFKKLIEKNSIATVIFIAVSGFLYVSILNNKSSIKIMKNDIKHINTRLNSIDKKVDDGFKRIDTRFNKIEERFNRLENLIIENIVKKAK